MLHSSPAWRASVWHALRSACACLTQTSAGGVAARAAACDQRATSVRAGCKDRPPSAVQACSLTAKLKSLKCKQKCARTAARPLQRCSLDFDACLKACATQTGS